MTVDVEWHFIHSYNFLIIKYRSWIKVLDRCLGIFLCVSYTPKTLPTKIIKQTFSIHYSSHDSAFPQSTSAIWIMPHGKAEGKATLWLRFPAIKAEGNGDRSWVRFWVFSCAKLDFVWKFLDWHLEQFFPQAQMLTETTFELRKLF